MKIARYRSGARLGYAIVRDVELYAGEGLLYRGLREGKYIGREQDVKFLPPVTPTKILAIGKNYRDHAKEMGGDAPKEPLLFMKAPTAMIGNDDPIVIPEGAGRIDYEGELVAVVGRRARYVSEDEALKYVLGYTCGVDVTARELQQKDGQWTRAKGFDTFAPIGPLIDTDGGPGGRRIHTRLNGKIVQDGNTDDMVFKLPTLIAYITRVMTLLPGDLVFTGTPSGVGRLNPGDTIEVEIAGIGILRNPVVAESQTSPSRG
ncbi:MAG: fumarylacetoacetate hydrolase family protein [Chloroflexi bacterium]|nr:fumarylacetoacetate hydrolase family protein [Chloroflexota bacterium]